MSLDRSNWLVPLFLILGVLLPTGCVLWFMNDAATSQAAAARQSVIEAYRGQLPVMRDRIETYWRNRAADLDSWAGAGTPADFAQAVKSGVADSIVYPGGYPQPVRALHPDVKPQAELLAAQSKIRGLVQAGNKAEALHAINETFVAGPFARATDSQGRLIAADEQLLALHLFPRADHRSLVALLNDYEHTTMPSSQRLFLMDEVLALDSASQFPTIEAERLAGQYLETNTAPKDTWRFASKSGRVVALYRTSTIIATFRSPSLGVRFVMLPPGAAVTLESSPGESIEAGALLPGWRISFVVVNTKPLEEAARARRASYLWAGCLVIGVMAVMGVFVGNVFRRQMRLARLKTDMVAAVSHELKTPLASMRLLVDSLLEDVRLDPAKTRDYLQLISGENQRLTRLIENFLTFSRIERNRQRFDFAPVQPADVIQAAANAMRERLQSPDCRFEVEAAPDLPLVQADEDGLITVLLNLIDNAYKYSPSRNETVKRISVRASHLDGEVVFEVQDNGIGIAPRDQKRIFRRFYQVDQRLARETGGCGLGLSIVEFIVKTHGGSVRVESRPGEGSTFIVSLPCAAQMREASDSMASLS